MSDEIQGHLPMDKKSDLLTGAPRNEIEDELSPIDPIEMLSRAGRPRADSAVKPCEPAPAELRIVETPVEVAAAPEPPAPPTPAPPTPAPAPEPEAVAEAKPVAEAVEAAAAEESLEAISDEFDHLLDQYLDKIQDFSSGDIVEAEIVDVKRTYVLVDVGDKAEGIIDIDEFVDSRGEIQVAVGDTIPVQILGRESETGQVHVSYRRAVGELAWQRISDAVRQQTPVTGRVAQIVRAGLIVDIGVPAFMPASQIDTSRVENLQEWVNREVDAYVIDFDRERRRVVLSRRKLVQEDQERKRRRILESLDAGQERVVRVKKIMDFGAFADLGGIDGLIPREEVSWERGSDPNDYLKEGRDLKVRILSVDRETGRVSLSRKRARPDPWEKIEEKYPVGNLVRGKVVGLADFGAFVSLEEGVRGMIHASDLSWAGGLKKVQDFLHVGDTVKAAVLDLDKERRRMALGLKQVSKDPWLEAEEEFQPQAVVKGTVTAVTKYGAFVRLNDYVEGLIHVSDMTWEKKPKSPSHYVQVGQEVEVVVLKTDRERRRISLGFKQMAKSPFERFVEEHREGSVVQGQVTHVTPFGAFVQLAVEVEGLIHISQLDDRRVENAEEAVQPGQTVEAKILKIDHKNQKIALSRKAYMREQETRQVAAYVSKSTSGGLNMGELLRGLNIRPVDSDRK
jgi:small subunit ribosomal protein S1